MNGGMVKTILGVMVSVTLTGESWGQQLSSEGMEKVKEALSYARLSDEIYNHKTEDDKKEVKVGEWTRLDSNRAGYRWELPELKSPTANSTLMTIAGSGIVEDPISFHAEVYKNGNGKIAIAFEGTGSFSLEDWRANFAQLFTVPAQYKAALEFTKKVIEGCSNDPGCNKNDIVVTGHSLGGGLAQYVSMMVDADVKAYTFNPAGLWGPTTGSIDTAKARNITNFYTEGYIETPGGRRIVGADPVSNPAIGEVFGEQIPIPVNLTGLWHDPHVVKGAILAGAGGAIADAANNLDNTLNLHSMLHLRVGLITLNRLSSPQTNLMQNQLTATTQFGSSHIGSAAYFMGRSPSQDFVRESKYTVAHIPTVRETSQTTNGFIIQAPVDIVLRWGAAPSDLDSHLTGPAAADGTRFHTYYAARGDLNAAPNAMLYRDVVTGLGPEQTRINVVQPGVYRFYVQDFTNRASANSTALSNSGAVVAVHAAGSFNLPEGNNLGAEVARVSVPTNQVGTAWQAFELDSRTGILNKTTAFRNIADPASVPFNQ